MPGYQPTNPRTHTKVGPCALCGRRKKRTDTHVPPKKAFNDGEVSRGMMLETDEGTKTTMSRLRPGGNRVWGLCEPCHRLTSPFDDEYISWAKACGQIVLARAQAEVPEDESFVLSGARPGRFIRAALAGMAAVAENLHEDHPALMETILTGEACEPPSDLRFLVGLTRVGERNFVEGIHRGVVLTLPVAGATSTSGVQSLPTPSATIHWFPFSLILVHADSASRYPHVDHTDWLREAANGDPRDVELRLPTVASQSVVTVPFGLGEVAE